MEPREDIHHQLSPAQGDVDGAGALHLDRPQVPAGAIELLDGLGVSALAGQAESVGHRAVGGQKVDEVRGDGSVALADYFLDEARVATVPGLAFGADAFIRFSFATALDAIKEAMQRIEKALAALQ